MRRCILLQEKTGSECAYMPRAHIQNTRTDRQTDKNTHTHSHAQGPAGDGAVPHRRLLFFWRLRNTALRELGPSAGVDVAQRVCPCVGVGVWEHRMTPAHTHAHTHAHTPTHIHGIMERTGGR